MTPRFIAETGIEVLVVTADQMREVDRIAIQETGPNLFQMMENAGRTLALLAIETLGDSWPGARVIVLAGGGGNGGGGICAARHLANRRVNVGLCLADPDGLGDVPAFQRKVFQSTSGVEIDRARIASEHPHLIIDALIGYGLRSVPLGAVASLIEWANTTGAPILALDIPSGVNATTGAHPGVCVEARWTLTLALPKTGLEPSTAGELWLADLGIPDAAYRRMGFKYVSPFGGRFRVRLTRAGRPAQVSPEDRGTGATPVDTHARDRCDRGGTPARRIARTPKHGAALCGLLHRSANGARQPAVMCLGNDVACLGRAS